MNEKRDEMEMQKPFISFLFINLSCVHMLNSRIYAVSIVVTPPWPKSVTWYNKEGKIETSEKYRLIEDGLGSYMIEIKPSESCDEGEWKCVVTSIEGCVGISTCHVGMESTYCRLNS
jgi:Immunoglobulin I-set domain